MKNYKSYINKRLNEDKMGYFNFYHNFEDYELKFLLDTDGSLYFNSDPKNRLKIATVTGFDEHGLAQLKFEDKELGKDEDFVDIFVTMLDDHDVKEIYDKPFEMEYPMYLAIGFEPDGDPADPSTGRSAETWIEDMEVRLGDDDGLDITDYFSSNDIQTLGEKILDNADLEPDRY